MRIGRASANSSITLPERSADKGGRPRRRWLRRMADLFEDLALVGGCARGRRRGRDDTGRLDANRLATVDIVVVVRRELDVAPDPYGAAVVGHARVVDAGNVDPVVREIDRAGQ